MTCKISFVKSIRETLKHHLAAFFATGIVFFIQLIVFFLSVQNISSNRDYSELKYVYETIHEMTLPSASYVIPVVFAAVLLGYDFFRSLHSKKQTDFYESLPVRRKDWFFLRMSSAFAVFLIPYMICTVLEMVLLAAYGFTRVTFFTNLLWNSLCMVLIFATVFFTAALAMIMTGHTVIAAFGFCVFSAYAPILIRYLPSSYAAQYFDTYVSESSWLSYLEYLSPFGLIYHLLGTDYLEWIPGEHVQDFIILIALIFIAAILSYFLFLKRPSEAAGRAMAFEKLNPYIRVLLVIPMTLYIGLYLSMLASVAGSAWMIFGYLVGTFLLHGIIESIFQFDIRGVRTHKKQMVFCFITCLTVAFIYWNDFFGYDEYVPAKNEIDTISIITGTGYGYGYDYDDDGIGDENLDTALQLVQCLIKEDMNLASNGEWIQYTYRLKNGLVQQRQYYMVLNSTEEIFDKLYATEDFKDNLCPLYDLDWETVSYVQWEDSVSDMTLFLSQEEMEHLFETYLAEYTPVTYSEICDLYSIGSFNVYLDSDDFWQFRCHVFPHFTQTISLLEKYMANNETTKDYGSLTESPLTKYPITSIEFYFDQEPLVINDTETIETWKEHMILSSTLDKELDWDKYYSASVCLRINDGYAYLDVLIPCEMVDGLL